MSERLPYTPFDLGSSVVALFDARSITGLADNASVSQWNDTSGYGNHATQATSGSRPKYRATDFNGYPCVRFDGIDDVLATPAFALAQPFTVVSLIRDIGIANNARYWTKSANSAGSVSYRLRQSTTGNRPVMEYTGNGTIMTDLSIADLTWHIAVASFNGAVSELRWDGVKSAVALDFSANGAANDFFAIGANGDATNPANIDVAFVMVVNRELDANERRKIEGWLAWSFGLQDTNLPVGHDYRGGIPYVPELLEGTSWTPAELGAKYLSWWDFSRLTGLVDGAAISSVPSALGDGRDLSQATSGNRPIYKTGIIGGLPVGRFDGSNDYLSSTLSAASLDETIVAVVRPISTAAIGTIVGASGNGGRQFRVRSSPSDLQYNKQQTMDMFDSTATLTAGTAAVVAGTINGTAISLAVNGTENAGTHAQTFTATTTWVGGRSNQEYFNGDIGEVVITTALRPHELRRIEGYLAHKWGLAASLDASHPYRYAPPILENSPPVITLVSPIGGAAVVALKPTFTALSTDIDRTLGEIDWPTAAILRIWERTGDSYVPFGAQAFALNNPGLGAAPVPISVTWTGSNLTVGKTYGWTFEVRDIGGGIDGTTVAGFDFDQLVPDGTTDFFISNVGAS